MSPSRPPRIPLWIDLRDVPARRRIPFLRAAQRVQADAIVVLAGDPEAGRPGTLVAEGGSLFRDGRPAGSIIAMRDAAAQTAAARAPGLVLVEGGDWTIIPLENLIAAREDRPGTLYALARTAEQAGVFRDTLERGVHGVALAPAKVSDIEGADAILRAKGLPGRAASDGARRQPVSPDPGAAQTTFPATGAGSGRATRAQLRAAPRNRADARGAPLAAAGTATPAAAGKSTPVAGGRSTASGRGKSTPVEGGKSTAGGGKSALGAGKGIGGDPGASAGNPGREPLPRASTAPDSASIVRIEPATVTAIEDAGPGDRVCVDTTSAFRAGEGLLVGSTARSFALVHAETIETEFVAARPFRVNAGALHSYVIAEGGNTRYLSELRAGSRVTAVDAGGRTRTLTVGRAKLEHRPHLLVTWSHAGGEGSAILQNAETIRLVRPGGEPVAVTHLKPGDQILVHREEAARHFGMPVRERLEER